MNKVRALSLQSGIPIWEECYIDLTAVIAIRELTNEDKYIKGISVEKGPITRLVHKIDLDRENGTQIPYGWIVPGDIHYWADQVETEKIRHKR